MLWIINIYFQGNRNNTKNSKIPQTHQKISQSKKYCQFCCISKPFWADRVMVAMTTDQAACVKKPGNFQNIWFAHKKTPKRS